MRLTVITFEVMLHPLDQLWLAVAEADHAGKVGCCGVSIIVVGELEIPQLVFGGSEGRAGCLDLLVIAQWTRISVFLVPILLPRQHVVIHLIWPFGRTV